ncbi:MAG: hypothetical protein ABW175_05645, partial [Bradyrhizobium sp.]
MTSSCRPEAAKPRPPASGGVREKRSRLGTTARARRSTAFNQEDAMGLFTKDIKTMDDLFLHGL